MKKTLPLLLFFTLNFTGFLIAQDNVNFLAGEKAYNAGNYILAESCYSRYIKTFTNDLPAYLSKLRVYDTCTTAEKLRLFPDFSINHKWAAGYYKRGMTNLNNIEPVQARRDFDMAIEIDPQYAEPYLQKGLLLKEKGRDQACKYISKAHWLSDTMKAAKQAYQDNFCWMCGMNYYIKGKTEVDLKQYTLALHNLDTAISLCHDSANYYVFRGVAYEGLENPDLAMADYMYALKLDSNNYRAHYHRALAYEKLQKYQESFDDLTKALLVNPKFANAYLHQAMDCENLDMPDAAFYDYQQVLHLNPDEGIAWYKVGLHKKQNGEDGCSYFQKAIDLGCEDAQPYADECNKAAARKALK